MIEALTLPVILEARSGPFELRRATTDDLGALIALLADDAVSAARGDRAAASDVARYEAGLRAVLASGENELVVATDEAGAIVATFQLTTIPGMSRRGATRMQVESVRVRSTLRSGGLGSAMMRWVLETAAPATGTALVQLTSDAQRQDAHRFYERLGFTDSHTGFKYQVS